MKDYWKNDPDAAVNIGGCILKYYATAGKLQIAKTYTDKNDGVEKIAKCIAIDLDALRETPEAVELLEKIISDIK